MSCFAQSPDDSLDGVLDKTLPYRQNTALATLPSMKSFNASNSTGQLQPSSLHTDEESY